MSSSEPRVLMDDGGAPVHPAPAAPAADADERAQRARYWKQQEARMRDRATWFEQAHYPLDQMIHDLVSGGAGEVIILVSAHGRSWGLGAIGTGDAFRESVKAELAKLLDERAARQFEIISLSTPTAPMHFEVVLGRTSWVKAGALQTDESLAGSFLSMATSVAETERILGGLSDSDHVDLFLYATPDEKLHYETEVGADLSKVPGAGGLGRLLRTSDGPADRVRIPGVQDADSPMAYIEQLHGITPLTEEDLARHAALVAMTGASGPRWIQWNPKAPEETTVLAFVVGTEAYEWDVFNAAFEKGFEEKMKAFYDEHPEAKATVEDLRREKASTADPDE